MKSIYFIKLLFFLIAQLCCSREKFELSNTQNLRDSLEIVTPIFKVLYSETKEQPIRLSYKSSNRPKNIDRGSMNFYKEVKIHTSDDNDYYNNIWDKGHIAPAASFSDTHENLKQTFTFLNCVLQNQYLNRGEWSKLEAQERIWDNFEELSITVDVIFTDSILPTGATIPSKFIKHIEFIESSYFRCFEFENKNPINSWDKYEVKHSH